MDPLHLTTSRHNGTLTLAVSGELDIATTELLRSHLLALLQEAGHSPRPGAELIVEVSRLSFIDAAGLGILVSVQNAALNQHTPLHISGVPPSMLRLLRITGLDEHLT
ncbi:STAS domain-containing protein [Nonomuraea sp. NPDC050404]|uniref:STAS domain-containing protein n=1 Tax=Nonomuraea sp. NPDC050404 TaxID=3155783 RepID=UPI0033F2F63D